MTPETNHLRRRFAAIALAVVAVATVAGAMFAQTAPADAQLFDRRQRQAPPSEGFNPFGLFSPLFQRQPREHRDRRERREQRSEPVDHSRAPSPKKSDAVPSRHVVVMGTALSDWLAFGLEEIYADRPEIGIVRKNHLFTGLVHFDSKDETTWPDVAREFLKDKNPDVIVVMLGLEDRQSIRERPKAVEDKKQQGDKPADKPGQPSIAAPEPPKKTRQSFEFRTEQWAEVYAKRVDEMIAVLKSKGAPVIWVGLPAIRGTRSTSDMIYLNDVFRARVERAGIVYVDVWDGFVDEAGRYTTFGPDVEGQARRLRTSEGVYLTQAGARKLAHYVERDIKRVMGTRLQPMAVPTLDESGQPTVLGPAARPVAGPIVSLTSAASASELLGGGRKSAVTDTLAEETLVKGAVVTPQAGRADNFFLTPEAAEAAKEAAKAKEEAEQAAKNAAKDTGKDAAKDATKAASVTPQAPVATAPPLSLIADEPKTSGRDERESSSKEPVASVDPAPATGLGSTAAPKPTPRPEAAPPGSAPARSAARPTENRRQQSNRPNYQRRPPPRAERRSPPIFDPLGLFR